MDKIQMDAPFVERGRDDWAQRGSDLVAARYMARSIDFRNVSAKEIMRLVPWGEMNRLALNVANGVASATYGCIYFIGPVDGSPLKIGISLNPFSRLIELQIGNWEELVLHGVIWADFEDAEKIEKTSHKIADKSGILARGEWVWGSLETCIDLVMEAAQKKKLPLFTPAMVIHNQGMALLARDRAGPDECVNFHLAKKIRNEHITTMVSRA